jgi:phage shock protein C
MGFWIGFHDTSPAMAETRKLYRSRTNRQVAGVCGGLAQYFNLDATLIRILFVVLAVRKGSGIVVYLALWIIVPQRAVRRDVRGGRPDRGDAV